MRKEFVIRHSISMKRIHVPTTGSPCNTVEFQSVPHVSHSPRSFLFYVQVCAERLRVHVRDFQDVLETVARISEPRQWRD
jgi:hypothetical protein